MCFCCWGVFPVLTLYSPRSIVWGLFFFSPPLPHVMLYFSSIPCLPVLSTPLSYCMYVVYVWTGWWLISLVLVTSDNKGLLLLLLQCRWKPHGVALSVTPILMSLSLKSIKVQIRQDLAMDVSATSCAMDRSLCPLPPQAETPTVPGQKPQSSSTQPQVEIKNRTLVFPPTASGESSGKYRTCQLNFILFAQ